MENYIIKTERLFLKEFDINDAVHFLELNSNPEVMKYTGNLPFNDLDDARQFVKNYTHYLEHGFGRWSIHRQSDNAFLGWCGLKQHEDYVDIGFRLMQKYWGCGYATEAAKACLEYGLQNLKLKEIVGRVDKRNEASIAVLEKLGMQYWKNGECNGLENAQYYKINFLSKKMDKNLEYECKLKALRQALIEGEQSGIVENFDGDKFLEFLKNNKGSS